MKIRGSIITLVLMCIAAPDKRLSPPAFAADLRPLAQLPYTPSLDTSAMDPSIDPCVDFFEYSCGSWPKSHPIPGDQPRWEVYDKVEDDNLQYLWGILTEAAKPETARSSAQQKIGDFFDSCMDESKIDALGAKPLAPELAAIAALLHTDAGDLAHERLHRRADLLVVADGGREWTRAPAQCR